LGKSANLKISTSGGSTATVENAVLPEGFCAFYWAVGLHAPRGLRVATNNDILVVEQGLSQITVLWQDNIFEQSSLPNLRLNQGIEIHDGYLYTSSSTAVYR